MKTLRANAFWMSVFLLGMAPSVLAQAPCSSAGCLGNNGIPTASTPNDRKSAAPPPPLIGNADGSMDSRLEHDQAKARNADRQKQLEADTQKLVALANELQADVQKSNKDMLSLDVVRKADEIEKLAK